MTEERKEYLLSISKEERLIREELEMRKNRIKSLKEYINKENVIIKNLKKQLPVPTFEFIKPYFNDLGKVNVCLSCGWEERAKRKYCPNCGQKLRLRK